MSRIVYENVIDDDDDDENFVDKDKYNYDFILEIINNRSIEEQKLVESCLF